MRKWILRCSSCGYLDYYSEHQLTAEKVKEMESLESHVSLCPHCSNDDLEVEKVET